MTNSIACALGWCSSATALQSIRRLLALRVSRDDHHEAARACLSEVQLVAPTLFDARDLGFPTALPHREPHLVGDDSGGEQLSERMT
jgi:hypothetical protein